MIILTKENILSYIKEHVPSLQLKEPVKVSMIGEGDLGEDVEGDGYCKAVYGALKAPWARPNPYS